MNMSYSILVQDNTTQSVILVILLLPKFPLDRRDLSTIVTERVVLVAPHNRFMKGPGTADHGDGARNKIN